MAVAPPPFTSSSLTTPPRRSPAHPLSPAPAAPPPLPPPHRHQIWGGPGGGGAEPHRGGGRGGGGGVCKCLWGRGGAGGGAYRSLMTSLYVYISTGGVGGNGDGWKEPIKTFLTSAPPTSRGPAPSLRPARFLSPARCPLITSVFWARVWRRFSGFTSSPRDAAKRKCRSRC